jgi:hypothetical protein
MPLRPSPTTTTRLSVRSGRWSKEDTGITAA